MGAKLSACHRGSKEIEEPTSAKQANPTNENNNEKNNNKESSSQELVNTSPTTSSPAAPAPKSIKVLVVFYSTYGHNYGMAMKVAEGASQVPGVQVDLRRVRETLPESVLSKMGALEAQKAFAHVPIADPSEFAQYDAVIVGAPTRFGLPAAQIQNYMDALGQIWAKNEAVGKIASCWTSTATQHGGQESTILAMHRPFMHLGMIVVGLPYTCTDQFGVDEVRGGTPYGTSTITGGDGSRMPSEAELRMAVFQGKHVAMIAQKLV